VEAVLGTGEHCIPLDSFNPLMTFSRSRHCGTIFKGRVVEGSSVGWAGAVTGSVRAARVRGESCKGFSLFVLLTMLIGLDSLALSARGLIQTQRGNPELEQARDRISFNFESNGSRDQLPKAPMGCLGMAREFRVGSQLIVNDSSADALGIGSEQALA
jgi:hypothetical protein